MNNISVSPGKNNVGAYVNNLDLNDLKDYISTLIKDILINYGVVFIIKENLDSISYQ